MTMERLLNSLYLLTSLVVMFFTGLVINLLIIMGVISEGVLLLTVAVGLIFHLLWVHRRLL